MTGQTPFHVETLTSTMLVLAAPSSAEPVWLRNTAHFCISTLATCYFYLCMLELATNAEFLLVKLESSRKCRVFLSWLASSNGFLYVVEFLAYINDGSRSSVEIIKHQPNSELLSSTQLIYRFYEKHGRRVLVNSRSGRRAYSGFDQLFYKHWTFR